MTPEIAKALKRSLELATKAVMAEELHVKKRGKSFFGFYETMLGEASRVKWARIVDTQVRVMPWTGLQGNVHNQEREHLADSFRDCVKFHLLSDFCMTRLSTKSTTLCIILKIPGRFL